MGWVGCLSKIKLGWSTPWLPYRKREGAQNGKELTDGINHGRWGVRVYEVGSGLRSGIRRSLRGNNSKGKPSPISHVSQTSRKTQSLASLAI